MISQLKKGRAKRCSNSQTGRETVNPLWAHTFSREEERLNLQTSITIVGNIIIAFFGRERSRFDFYISYQYYHNNNFKILIFFK